jgi:hypothetical protein
MPVTFLSGGWSLVIFVMRDLKANPSPNVVTRVKVINILFFIFVMIEVYEVLPFTLIGNDQGFVSRLLSGGKLNSVCPEPLLMENYLS